MDNNKITIMHLRSSQQISSVLFGGESIVLDICRFLNKDKFEPIIVALQDKRAKGELPLTQKSEEYELKTETINLAHPFDFRAVAKLRDLLKRYNIDILHCHEYKSDFIGWLAKKSNKDIKLVSTIHGYTSGNIKLKFYEYVDKLILRYFDKIITVSPTIKQVLSGYSGKVSVVPNAIDYEKYQIETDKSSIIKELGISQEARVIGTIGRLSPEKGYQYFLHAAKDIIKKFPKTVFLIVGDGPSRKELEELALKYNLKNKVIFTGFRRDTVSLLAVMDIFVLPSLTEGMPIAILEAMASGKPIVATRVGGVPTIIKDGRNGILVESKNKNALASATLTLLQDRGLREKLAEEAKSLVKENFSAERMAGSYEEIYLDLIKR